MFHALVNSLRARLRSWLGVADIAPEVPPPAEPASGLKIDAYTLLLAGKTSAIEKMRAPVLPPGVVPDEAYDADDDPANLGAPLAFDDATIDGVTSFVNNAGCGVAFPGYAYLAELSQRSEYRAASETIASEMTREWIELTIKGDKETQEGLEEKRQALMEALEEFGIREKFQKLAELDGYFGRAQLFIDIDPAGRDPFEQRQLPLVIDEKTIRKGSLLGFTVIEPLWTTPYTYDATDPTSPYFYTPRAWYVMGRKYHATRLLTFVSRPLPDMLKPAYNFSGLSMSQLMEPYVYQWLRVRNSVADLVHNFSVMILQTDMSQALSGQPDSGTDLLARAQLFIANRDNQGLTLIDKQREEILAVNVPLSGLDALQAQAQEHMAAPTHIPLVKLLGITPTGLNANSEGEIQVFYDFVRASQEKFFSKHLNTVLQILQLHLFGQIDDAIGFRFVPLSAPTIKELSEIRSADAQTDSAYIDRGVVSADEVREKLSADPNSGYNNLTGSAPLVDDTLPGENEFDQ